MWVCCVRVGKYSVLVCVGKRQSPLPSGRELCESESGPGRIMVHNNNNDIIISINAGVASVVSIGLTLTVLG